MSARGGAPARAQSLEAATPPANVRDYTLPSTVLSETRRVIVRLPRRDDSDGAQRYPVVYKLDGTNGFARHHQAIDILHTADLMPDAIVVAIPNGRGLRNRDLTPPTLHQNGGEDGEESTGEMGGGVSTPFPILPEM